MSKKFPFTQLLMVLVLCLLLAVVSVPQVSLASEEVYRITLRSREFIPTPGIDPSEKNQLETTAVEGDGYVHALLQLQENVSPAEREALADAENITFHLYIPNHAWVATLPGTDLDTLISLPQIRWIGELQIDDKLAPEIRDGQFEAWNYDPVQDVAFVVVQLHPDVPLSEADGFVGGGILQEVPTINSVVAAVSPAVIPALAADNRVLWVEFILPSLTETNDGSRAALHVDVLQPAPYNPTPTYDLDGNGIDLLVYDAGLVDTHDDFGTRLTQGDTSAVNYHATHVAGTAAGDGSRSAQSGGTAHQYRGMAPGADVISYGYEWDGQGTLFFTNLGDINNDWRDAKNRHGADVGTASLGSNTSANGYPCNLQGNYGATSQLIDNIVRGSFGEPYITTWAAGNERGPVRCGQQFNTTAPPACAKNPIHVGATNSDDDSMTDFSSWGPCDDGRLKPVIVAPGCETAASIRSTWLFNQYGNLCGTSMATPAVAGVVTLMLEEYRDRYNTTGEFLPSTAKAILMNTATDLGTAGPDFQFGYGLVHAQRAVDAIINGHFYEDSIVSTNTQDEYTIQVPSGAAQLQVSLAWDDPAVAPLTAQALVNDLDLVLVDPSGTTHRVWVLDPANPTNAATAGTDNLNNQEQVTINNPAAGTWTVRISGTNVPTGPQRYSLAATHTMTPPKVDVWIRDNTADTGVEPSSGRVYLSPDVWVRHTADGNTQHQNPEFGQTNYIYLNVRNRGGVAAQNVTVEVYWANLATVQLWPQDWTLAGTTTVSNVAAGGVSTISPIAWSPPGVGHYCLYIRLVTSQDPIGTENTRVADNTRNNNNAAWRNLTIVDTTPNAPKTSTFIVRNPSDEFDMVDLVFDSPLEEWENPFAANGDITIQMDPTLYSLWQSNGGQGSGFEVVDETILRLDNGEETILADIPLQGFEEYPVTVTFAAAPGGLPGQYTVDVVQRDGNDVESGGVRYEVAIPDNQMANGDFEAGMQNWIEYSSHGYDLICPNCGTTAHGGSYLAWLGGADDETSSIRQSVSLPVDQTIELNFWYWLDSVDYCGYDWAAVQVDAGGVLTEVQRFDLCTSTDTDGWEETTLDLTSFAGQTVDLIFYTETDYSLISHFYVDDVTLFFVNP